MDNLIIQLYPVFIGTRYIIIGVKYYFLIKDRSQYIVYIIEFIGIKCIL